MTVKDQALSFGAPLAVEGRSGCATGTGVDGLPGPMPDHILDVAYGFWRSKALLSAVELGLFTVLAEGPLSCEVLRARLELHSRGVRDFVDALVALGFLYRDAAGRYHNTPDADAFLDQKKPTYIGGLLEHLNLRHYHNWGRLTEALRSGTPQSQDLGAESYPGLYANSQVQQLFLSGMTAGSLIAAKAITTKFPWQRYQSFLDIGTAQGCAPVQIALAHPHLTGGGFDLPQVEPVFTAFVEEHGLANRLRFFAGDFFSDVLPAADVLIMGRILHNWAVPARKMLLRKAYQALPPGGVLIVYDPLIETSRGRDPHGLLSSLNMLIETEGGSEYTAEECIEWMREAGFTHLDDIPLGDMHTAVIGEKGR
jgi:SAM-dependent methyltransferase